VFNRASRLRWGDYPGYLVSDVADGNGELEMDKPVELELGGLSDLDRDELEALLADSGIVQGDYRLAKSAVAGADRAQDFGVSALVIAIAPVAIAAISAWLLKKRQQESCNATVRVYYPNGQLSSESRFAWKSSKSAPPPPEIVKTMAEATQVNLEDIEKGVAALGG
jgi:hypothetical protein